MEFIPIKDKYTDKKKNGKGKFFKGLDKSESPQKTVKKEIQKPSKEINDKKIKAKPQIKKVKNKYKEWLVEKQKEKSKKKKPKQKKVEQEEEDDEESENENEPMNEDVDDNADNDIEENEDDDDDTEGDEEEEDGEEEEEEEEEQDDAEKKLQEKILKKRRELDEKKKNRLFIKLKKKIHSEAQIKELHPDIRGVIFPRKKNTRWCWAVFVSEEKANAALPKLIKNKEIIASKPTPREKVEIKREQKMKDIHRRKEARKKMKAMWM